jgi:hypothetical protein
MSLASRETALAHVVGDKAEQAYRRSDALEKRRKLMDAWAAAFCEPKTSVNVVPLRKHQWCEKMPWRNKRSSTGIISWLPLAGK